MTLIPKPTIKSNLFQLLLKIFSQEPNRIADMKPNQAYTEPRMTNSNFYKTSVLMQPPLCASSIEDKRFVNLDEHLGVC